MDKSCVLGVDSFVISATKSAWSDGPAPMVLSCISVSAAMV